LVAAATGVTITSALCPIGDIAFIQSPAVASAIGGTVRPSTLAIFELKTQHCMLACCL
jgi:hypothetical protein